MGSINTDQTLKGENLNWPIPLADFAELAIFLGEMASCEYIMYFKDQMNREEFKQKLAKGIDHFKIAAFSHLLDTR